MQGSEPVPGAGGGGTPHKRLCEDLGAQTWDTRRGHNNPGKQVRQVKGSLGQCDFTRLPTPPRAVVIVLSPASAVKVIHRLSVRTVTLFCDLSGSCGED